MKKMQEQSNFNEIKDMGGVEILTKIKILKLRIYRHKTILMKERVSGLLLKLKTLTSIAKCERTKRSTA